MQNWRGSEAFEHAWRFIDSDKRRSNVRQHPAGRWLKKGLDSRMRSNDDRLRLLLRKVPRHYLESRPLADLSPKTAPGRTLEPSFLYCSQP